jgi:hypothetical protein
MADYNDKLIDGAIQISSGHTPLRMVSPDEVAKRFVKSMRVLAREAPNLRQCYFGVSPKTHIAINELLLSHRRSAAAGASIDAVRKFMRQRMMSRARKGWKRLRSLHT